MRDDEALERVLRARTSCRAFDGRVIPLPVLDRLLTLAQSTPSWCNTQPWHVTITSGVATDTLRHELAAHAASGARPEPDLPMPTSYSGVYRDRRRESGWALYDAVGVRRGDRAGSAAQARRNFEFFGAPHVAVVTFDAEQGPYAAVDTGLYVQSFVLAATSLGLATCVQAAIAAYAPFIRERLDIPSDRAVLVGIALGYADPTSPVNRFRTSRAPIREAATHRDRLS